jgi:pimeloyl-ACP methyl ester carboxylesterase
MIDDAGLGIVTRNRADDRVLLAGLDAWQRLGRPLLVAASRKRFPGTLTADPATGDPRSPRAAGAVITRAARDASNVQALVYVAAFQPDEGESALENASRFPGAKMGPDTTIATEHAGEPELRILPEHYQDVIAGDLPTETTDILAVTQRPVRVQALTAELSGAPAWRTLPSWAVVATQDNAIPAQAQEFMAERAGSHIVRVEASHAVSISQPDTVADLIIEAAKATR